MGSDSASRRCEEQNPNCQVVSPIFVGESLIVSDEPRRIHVSLPNDGAHLVGYHIVHPGKHTAFQDIVLNPGAYGSRSERRREEGDSALLLSSKRGLSKRA